MWKCKFYTTYDYNLHFRHSQSLQIRNSWMQIGNRSSCCKVKNFIRHRSNTSATSQTCEFFAPTLSQESPIQQHLRTKLLSLYFVLYAVSFFLRGSSIIHSLNYRTFLFLKKHGETLIFKGCWQSQLLIYGEEDKVILPCRNLWHQHVNRRKQEIIICFNPTQILSFSLIK